MSKDTWLFGLETLSQFPVAGKEKQAATSVGLR